MTLNGYGALRQTYGSEPQLCVFVNYLMTTSQHHSEAFALLHGRFHYVGCVQKAKIVFSIPNGTLSLNGKYLELLLEWRRQTRRTDL